MKINRKDIETIVKESIKRVINESMISDDIDSEQGTITTYISNVKNKISRINDYVDMFEKKVENIKNILINEMNSLNIDIQFIGDEISSNDEYEMNFSIDLNQVKNAILRNKELLNKLTSEYGVYENQDINNVLNNEKEVIEIFNYYILDDININGAYTIEINDMRKYNRGLSLSVITYIPDELRELKRFFDQWN